MREQRGMGGFFVELARRVLETPSERYRQQHNW
jgi:hypothetical protein